MILFFSDELQLPKGALKFRMRTGHLPSNGRKRSSSPEILFPESLYPELRETIFYRNTQRFARELLGDDDLVCWGHMVRKAPGSMDPTPWAPG